MKGKEVAILAVAGAVVSGLVVYAAVRFVLGRRAAKRADGGRWASYGIEPRALGEVKPNEDNPPRGGIGGYQGRRCKQRKARPILPRDRTGRGMCRLMN